MSYRNMQLNMKKLKITLLLAVFTSIANFGYAQNTSKSKPSASKSVAEPEMIFVEGGRFMMGCSGQGSNCASWEKPAHQVTISSFYIGKYEATQAQWKAIMGNNPSNFRDDNLPVENVSWNEVQKFISKLNALTGKQYRLPTEAEWEFACRGGTHSAQYKYSGSNTVNDVAWHVYNSEDKTHAVGTKLPNELGIYDMSGNVYEWCNDWFGDYSSDAQNNPKGTASGTFRVGRGGSWSDFPERSRVSYRIIGMPDDHDNAIGFRLACDSK